MRKALYEGLVKQNAPGDWKPIMEQRGMFSVLGLPLAKVMELRGKISPTDTRSCRC